MNLSDREINEISKQVSSNIEALVIEAIKVINISLSTKFDTLKEKLITDILENSQISSISNIDGLIQIQKEIDIISRRQKSYHKSVQLLNWLIGMPFRWISEKPYRLSFLLIPASLFIALLFLSCSPQQRLNRIVNNHPELLKPKSFNFSDIIKVPGKQVNFIFPLDSISTLKENDSIVTSSNNITSVIFRKNDRVEQKIIVHPDTIHYNKKIDVPTIIVQKKPKSTLFYIAAVTLILLLLATLTRLFRK